VDHATLATKRTLLLTWAGLAPAGSHQLAAGALIRSPHRRERVLFKTEFFGVTIEHKALTCDEPNFQQASVAVVVLSRNALHEGVALEQGIPYGWEIISIPHQLGAQLREIA
jgi:hypothetical protein